MSNTVDEKFRLKYFQDEIQVVEARCLEPWNCSCKNTTEKCCMTPFEARTAMIKYYQGRVDYLSKLTDKEFLHDAGFYY